MLDSQHSTAAFSSPKFSGVHLKQTNKKADGEDLAVCSNNPIPPAILQIKLVELIGIEPTTS